MDHRSDAPGRAHLTVRSASLALVLVGASLALAIAVHGAGGVDAAPATPSVSPTAPLAPSSIWRVAPWVSSGSSPAISSTTTPPPVETESATRLAIQGEPPAAVNYGSPYSFTPKVSGSANPELAFSIQNKPQWAAFDSSSGALTGTPEAGDVGTDANIVISVNDGASTTALAPFSINVNEVSNGAATLNWSDLTQGADTTLTDLAGYVVYYGTSVDNLNQRVKLENSGLTSYVVTNLASGTWYFRIAAYSTSGVEGVLSGVVQKTIP